MSNHLGPRGLAVVVAFMVGLLLLPGTLTKASAQENLLPNGNFEQGQVGWPGAWSREGEARVEMLPHDEGVAAKVEHVGARDWSFPWHERLAVQSGDIFELSAQVRAEGEGSATLGAALFDTHDDVEAIDWFFAAKDIPKTGRWETITTRLVIPDRDVRLWPRITGDGSAVVWVDDVVLRRIGSIAQFRVASLPERVTCRNDAITVTFDTRQRTLAVTDHRTGRVWRQHPTFGLVTLSAKESPGGLALRLLDTKTLLRLDVTVRLDAELSECMVDIACEGTIDLGEASDASMDRPIHFPSAFASPDGSFLVMPVNEGISYPVDDETLPEMRYHLYGGHGLSMAWWGVTDGREGLMAIIPTPDDAAASVPRIEGRLVLSPEWLPTKGRFGATRRIRYVLFDTGGYVAMCKRYREQAERTGLVKTLDEKRRENPDVDKLIGAVNVWGWGVDAVDVCTEMQALGIDRILWSHRESPQAIRRMNALGILTSRYDIYQDVMDPGTFDKLRHIHPDWTTDAWPDDLNLDARGQWLRGWEVTGRDGQRYPCGVVCDAQAVAHARRRIPPELSTHPYRCRFIDTTTATPWRECYHPDHPTTRTESRRHKTALLDYISRECKLVVGSETGHEAAVPYLHYFEGMMSLGPYRLPDAGRDISRIWNEAPERVRRFQTGPYYRLPLWELVYHDCVVSYWYWGDYNNKILSLWRHRDLYNLLYATPPMFMFNPTTWRENRHRFAESYSLIAQTARPAGDRQMLSHQWLTTDHAVQRTRFSDGMTVTVNFGPNPRTLSDGTRLGPMEHQIVTPTKPVPAPPT